ncbi:MAG TPA: XrtA/PEP-CTERM system histidine kinase PrsK [Candidatus Dormibacteraeota bacterium]|nr:XrtA/PEP-CTERM system histidine kinase PrsK [Candidatus Dormibacteraeota bacterium]
MDGEPALNPASIGYVAAAILYAALAVIALTRWRRGLAGLWIANALAASAAWAALLSMGVARAPPGGVVDFFASTIRAGLWLLVLTRIIPGSSSPRVRYIRVAALAAPFVVLAAGASISVLADLGNIDRRTPLPQVFGGLLLSLFGLVLLEQAMRNATASDRWALKHVLLGIGATLTFDLVLYASSWAFGTLDLTLWEARGAFNVVAALVLATGLARLSRHRPPAQSSQGIVFYTGTLIAVGLLLLVIAFGGWYVRVAGGSWGASLQALFVGAAILALVVALFSAQVRAWAIVVLTKTFAPYRYDYRAEWLRLTEALSGAEDPRPLAERALRALIRVVHSPSGGLWLREQDGCFVPVAGGLSTAPANTVDVAAPWLQILAAREWILDLSVTPPRELQPLTVPEWLTSNPRAWLIVPLLRAQALEGFVVAARPLTPSAALTWEDLDLLKATARQVAAFLAFERVAQHLAQSQQFEAYNRFAAFMMHDLKNVAAQLALIVQNAEQHRRNPSFVDDAITTVDNASHRMQRLLEQFRQGGAVLSPRRVDVVAVCRQVVERCGNSEPRPMLAAHDDSLEATLDPERLSHVIEHVVRNAQQATAPSGTVTVGVARRDARIVIEVTDTGCGMDAEFVRDKLFRPFQSTKGTQGMGIGAYQTREFVRGAGGAVRVASEVGRGTKFTIELPVAAVRGGALG